MSRTDRVVRQLWPIYGPVRRPTSAPTNIVPLNDLAWQILESVDNTTAGNCFSAGEKEDFGVEQSQGRAG